MPESRDWQYRREWREALRSGRPEELAGFRARWGQGPIPAELAELAYHVAVHRAAELHDGEKEGSRGWLRAHAPGWERAVTEWPPTSADPGGGDEAAGAR